MSRRRISKRQLTVQPVWKQVALDGQLNSLMADCVRVIQDCGGSALLSPLGDRTQLPELIHDLFTQGVNGVLKASQVVAACNQLSQLHDEIPSLIMDVANIIDAELVVVDRKPRERFTRLSSILAALDSEWCSKMCRTALELDTLSDCGIITKSFLTKSVKIKTKLYYKQNKYNLFREDIEGFSKIIVELNRFTNMKVKNVNECLLILKSIIGSFSLDPTRVLDCILEVFQTKINDYQFLINLLKKFVPEIELLYEVIGFRYVRYSNGVTPKSYHRLVCVLLHFDYIKLEEILPWMTPDEKGIAKDLENAEELNKHYIKDKNYHESDKNQKLGLCEEALAMGSWKIFKELMTFFPENYLLEKPIIALSITRLVHYLVDPLLTDPSLKPLSKRKVPVFKFEVTPVTAARPKSCEELSESVFPLLITLGAGAHYDAKLLMKLARLLAKVMDRVNSDSSGRLDVLRGHIADVIVSSLLPSLSHLGANCCVSESLWGLLKMFPLQMRYSMYYAWRTYVLKHNAALSKKCQGKVNMKACMKRVSKENVKQIGRLLGKISHYSPATLFDYILFQIQMYDNLIGPVVDSLKYMTSLSFDVMGFCIYDSLQNDPKKRPKHDGLAISPWFLSTSLFCATAFKKYNVDLSGILLYIADQLSKNSSAELRLLKEIMHKMGGVLITNEMTQHQIESLGGGELLKAEAGYFFQQKNFKKTAARLKDALVENNLTLPLGMILAQHKNHIMFVQSRWEDLSFIGQLYDECHDTLLQFVTFITTNINDLDNLMPPLIDLMCVHKLEPSSAFCLYRPILHFHVHRKYTYTFRGSTVKTKQQNTEIIMFKWIKDISYVFKRLWPTREWDDMSPEFVALFWALDLSDLKVPKEAYEKEINKYKELEQTQGKQTKDAEKANTMHEKLSQELKDQENHVTAINKKLREEKDKWLLPCIGSKPSKNEMITQFLRICIFPRCIYSVLDALYCAELINTLHQIKTKNFSTLLFYDRLFCDITFAVMSCTEDEANRFGTFLCSVLQNIMRWHKTKETFDSECANTPGFQTKYRSGTELSEDNGYVHYENFRHVCHKWHYKITKSLLALLDSKDYIQVRNSITVLIKMLPVYPVIDKLCLFIDRRIDKIKETERNNRKDLFTLASSYSGQLMAKIESWVQEQDFHLVSDPNYTLNISDENQMDNDVSENSPIASPKSGSPDKDGEALSKSDDEDVASPPAKKKPKPDLDGKSSSPSHGDEIEEKLEYHRSRGGDDILNAMDVDEESDRSGRDSKKDKKSSGNPPATYRKKSESPRDEKRTSGSKYSSTTSPRSSSSAREDSAKLKKSKSRKAKSSEPKKDKKPTKRRERVRSEDVDFSD